jgi:hypothetical protein
MIYITPDSSGVETTMDTVDRVEVDRGEVAW